MSLIFKVTLMSCLNPGHPTSQPIRGNDVKKTRSVNIDLSGKQLEEKRHHICRLPSCVNLDASLWLATSTHLTDHLFKLLKPARVVQISGSIHRPFVVTVVVRRRYRARARRLIAKYLHEHGIRVSL
jgi:hypothetical protein